MKEPTEAASTKRQEDYLVANLLDFFRSIENESKWFHAAKIALNQIERTTNLTATKLDKRFIFFASKLKNNISVASLRLFAQECLASAIKTKVIRIDDQNSHKASSANLRKKASRAISNSLSDGHSHSAAVLRAANSLKRDSSDEQIFAQRATKIKNHPLHATLEVLNTNQKRTAKEDIRNHLLNLKNFKTSRNPQQGILLNILKKAQSFSVNHLHQLLGDELFHLCRPLGFLDQNDTTVVVEVPSNAHLHALTYRKNEILMALRKDNNFIKARFIKFKVKGGWL